MARAPRKKKRELTEVERLCQYFTPEATAQRIVEFARIKPGMRVLEPSCGEGALIKHLLAAGAIVVGVELDPKLVPIAAATGAAIVQGDFLALDTGDLGLFDRVVSNPPFRGRMMLQHVSHMLGFAPDTVAHIPVSGMTGKNRWKGLWSRACTTRRAVCVSRPPYRGKGGRTDMMTVDIELLGQRRKRPPVIEEYWP